MLRRRVHASSSSWKGNDSARLEAYPAHLQIGSHTATVMDDSSFGCLAGDTGSSQICVGGTSAVRNHSAGNADDASGAASTLLPRLAIPSSNSGTLIHKGDKETLKQPAAQTSG